ncbi:MAG: hypothetical protein ACLPND_11945 [Candidatus Korobacteraceae bacterium]
MTTHYFGIVSIYLTVVVGIGIVASFGIAMFVANISTVRLASLAQSAFPMD